VTVARDNFLANIDQFDVADLGRIFLVIDRLKTEKGEG
jgi:hypothetical protein